MAVKLDEGQMTAVLPSFLPLTTTLYRELLIGNMVPDKKEAGKWNPICSLLILVVRLKDLKSQRLVADVFRKSVKQGRLPGAESVNNIYERNYGTNQPGEWFVRPIVCRAT